MSTFGVMQTRIADELNIPELVSRIKPAILSAITFYENERFFFNEAEATTPTIAGQANYAVPSDFLELDSFTLVDGDYRDPIGKRPWEWMRRAATSTTATAEPRYWAYYSDQFWLYPTPDSVYTLKISYLKRLTALSGVDDTNAWMVHGEELIRNRAKYDILLSTQNFEAAAGFNVATTEALANLQRKSQRRIRSSPLTMDSGLVASGRFNIYTG